MEKVIPGLWTWKNAKNRFTVVKLHYSADPDKATPEWKENTQAGMPAAEWQREYEINFEQQRGGRVFPEYVEVIHRKDLSEGYECLFNPFLTVYRGWDFGYRHPACVVTQVDTCDVWRIYIEFLGTSITLEEFIPVVLDKCPYEVKVGDDIVPIKYRDFCDPAGTQKTDKDKRSSIEILQAAGIHPMYKRSGPVERARIIRSKLLNRPDGNPGLLLHSDCKVIHSGFHGGYHFPEVENPNDPDAPEKDGFYEHLFDGLGYIAYNIFRYLSADPAKRRDRQRPRYVQHNFNRFTGA